jgi:hypothetical protein
MIILGHFRVGAEDEGPGNGKSKDKNTGVLRCAQNDNTFSLLHSFDETALTAT